MLISIFNSIIIYGFLVTNNKVTNNKLYLNSISTNKHLLADMNMNMNINQKFNYSNSDSQHFDLNFNLNINNEFREDLNQNGRNDDDDNDNDNDNFPSFYKFMREREKKELEKKEEYLNKEKTYFMETSSKDLKLLTSISAIQWARTWIYEMVNVENFFPTFMFQDMYRMRDFGEINQNKNFFYIGYFPTDVNLKKGPFYIGAFQLIPQNRTFSTHLIIQNPFHCLDNKYDYDKIINFKKELEAMTNDANVVFKFTKLQNNNDQRYYYSWLYDDNREN
tara:strand:+ start:451 stop:1284 length:834 start_codon:yes stop_codon:yes gene_type:complete